MEKRKKGAAKSRRVRLSVLFCDIKGFTAMARRLDSERLNFLLHGFIKSMSGIIHRYGGEVDKVMGDGLLAFFAPSSLRRSTAHQALSAALAMQAEIRGQRKAWQDAAGDLLVRIGIATGPVDVSELALPNRREAALIGHHVNLAARLQDMAPAGSVLVSERTFRAAQTSFSFQKVEGLELKGFDDAVVAYRAGPKKPDEAPAKIPGPQSPQKTGPGEAAVNARRYRRRDLDIDLRIRTSRGSVTLRSINISEGGMFIATEDPEPKGTLLTIDAWIPTTGGTYPISIDGLVVWSAGCNGVDGMGVRFTTVHSSQELTMAQLVREIFSLRQRDLKSERSAAGAEAPMPARASVPLFWGKPVGLSYSELGTANPEMLSCRVSHEYDRARRYGSDFSCISLLIDIDRRSSAPGDIREALLAVRAALKESLRSTDDFAYFGDGLFFILAPETLPNRAETLIKRTLVRIQARLQKLEGSPGSFVIRSGASTFDRQNTASPQEVLEAAVGKMTD